VQFHDAPHDCGHDASLRGRNIVVAFDEGDRRNIAIEVLQRRAAALASE
jgi:hypothetical protein